VVTQPSTSHHPLCVQCLFVFVTALSGIYFSVLSFKTVFLPVIITHISGNSKFCHVTQTILRLSVPETVLIREMSLRLGREPMTSSVTAKCVNQQQCDISRFHSRHKNATFSNCERALLQLLDLFSVSKFSILMSCINLFCQDDVKVISSSFNKTHW